MVSSIKEEMKKVKIEMVKEFLLNLGKCLNKTGSFSMERKDQRNAATMVALDFKTEDVVEVLRSLTYHDYSAGPEENESSNAPKLFKNGDVWTFGKVVHGLCKMEVYIKICFVELSGIGYTCCISFHEPVYTIAYPLKNG